MHILVECLNKLNILRLLIAIKNKLPSINKKIFLEGGFRGIGRPQKPPNKMHNSLDIQKCCN
jgi:hypothetical protein